MSARIENEYTPLDISPPGLTLEEALEERGMSQAELAERAGRPKKTINEIIRGQAAITPDTAIQLERVLDIPASFWSTRQQQYDESRARAQARRLLAAYVDWPRHFPVAQMTRWMDSFQAICRRQGGVSPSVLPGCLPGGTGPCLGSPETGCRVPQVSSLQNQSARAAGMDQTRRSGGSRNLMQAV